MKINIYSHTYLGNSVYIKNTNHIRVSSRQSAVSISELSLSIFFYFSRSSSKHFACLKLLRKKTNKIFLTS
ncbi:unnamed protein product [Chironomus riparius]|uniref:Uncharacterized protein n=1 Tax=Chironomus riparius TaxID=315576 RepID=A0A9N9RIR5_9DIPT|nr:unnamed protein product [Chironomus riparius]